MHFCTYQKTLIHTLFCLFLKSSKAFSVSLTGIPDLRTVSDVYILYSILLPKNGKNFIYIFPNAFFT